MKKQTEKLKKNKQKHSKAALFLTGISIFITLFLINLVGATAWTNTTSYANYTFDDATNYTKDTGVTKMPINIISGGFSAGSNCVVNGCGNTTATMSATLNGATTQRYGSFGGWMKSPDLQTYQYLLGYNGATWYQISLGEADYRLRFIGASGSDIYSLALPENTWFHFVYKMNTTGVSIWINGTMVNSSNSVGNTFFGPTTAKGIFSNHDGTNGIVAGTQFDELRFYDNATVGELNASEILEWYQTEFNPSTISNIRITLNYPSNNSVLSVLNTNLTATFNITDGDNNYTWRNATFYNWKNNTIYNQSIVYLSLNNTQNFTNITGLTIGDYTWNVYGCYANNTFSNCTWSGNNTFSVGASLNYSTYNVETFETSLQTFTATFNVLAGSSIALTQLIYNGTAYPISNISLVGNTLTISKTINIPLNYNASSNQTNSFKFRFVYAGSSIQDSEMFYQNVSFIDLRKCASPYNLTALNFTLLDENNLSLINPTTNAVTFKSTFRYWLGDGSVYKNYSYQLINSSLANANNFTFCIYPYYPNNYTFKTDLDSIFSAIDFSENEYYLRNATLTNQTAAFDLYLYLLNSAESTKFYVTVKQGISFVDNALTNIAKYFIGTGDYKTTSIKLTDNDGKFPAYLDLDAKYLFSIVKNGQVLGIIEKTASCASAPCTIDINLDQSILGAFDGYNSLYASNIYSNITYNTTTKMVTYVFVDTTGLANYFRFEVKQMSFNGTIGKTICNKFSYSSFGSMDCNMTGYNGDFTAYGYISRSPEKIDKVFGFFISDALTTLGLLGIFLNIAIIVTGILSVAATTKGNPSAVIFALGLIIILLKIGGIFPFSWAVVVPIELLIVWALTKVKS